MLTERTTRGLAALIASCAAVSLAPADELASNLEEASADVEAIQTCCRRAATFRTDDAAHLLSTVILRLATEEVSNAIVTIHDDAGLEPGGLLATLSSPSSYPAVLDDVTFTATGDVELMPDTTYWVVLVAESGSFDWAWTETEDGSGPGFSAAWAASIDEADAWWYHDRYPLQMEVRVDETTAVPGDVNGDGVVDFDDLLAVLAQWGACTDCSADLDGNGAVDFNDLLVVLSAWSS